MICCLCNEEEKFYTKCVSCSRVFCKTCVDLEQKLKSPIISNKRICIFCRIHKTKEMKPKILFVERNVTIEF